MKQYNGLSLPFSALLGLADPKIALILSIIDPKIGGVLISGPKGTGKSSLVRSLSSILPSIEVMECPFQCSPVDPRIMCEACRTRYSQNKSSMGYTERPMRVITMPLGATEDRVIGSLDIEKIIDLGIEALSPGILASVNQEILYIDEINLLPDHLVDTILDCAASGVNIIERENISVQHPSNFILIGTMNPEEGELRPQLLDRLSLFAQAGNVKDLQERMRIIEINLALEERKSEKLTHHVQEDQKIRNKIIQARNNLSSVQLSEENKLLISKLCIDLEVDGFRSDIVLARASRAFAAFEGRNNVQNDDILRCAYLTLLHRTREGGLREPPNRIEIQKNFGRILEKK